MTTAASSSIASSQLAFFVSGVVANGNAAPAMAYRRVGEAFASDRRHHGELLDVGENVTVRFALPNVAEADFLQLDVPAIPGVYRIERLVVRGAVVADLARRVIAVGERLLENAGPAMVRYAADAQRPTLEVDIRGIAVERAAQTLDEYVDVVIVREDAAVELRTALALRVEDLSGLVRKQTRELGDLGFGHGQELRRQSLLLRDQEKQLLAILEGVAGQARSLEPLREQVGELPGRVQAQFDVLAQDLSLAHEKLDRLMACMQQVQAEIGQVNWSLENVFWRRWLRRLRGVRK